MKIRSALVLGIVLLFGTAIFAQDNPKVEISADYSYIHANPQNNDIIRPFSLNGGGGGVAYYFNRFIGFEGDFQGYGSYTHSITIDAGTPLCPGETVCFIQAQGNLFTYTFGPIFKFRTKHVEPFLEALFGGAHSNLYTNLFTACGIVETGCITASRAPDNNAFDFTIGGGLDIPVTKHFAIRPVQLDYVLTRFGSSFTAGNNNQSNFRYQAGLVFRFGGAPPPPPNHPPVASCSAVPAMVYGGSGDSVLVRANASDPDNDPLNYTWTATGGTVDGTSEQARWNSTGLANGDYTVSARVDDGRGGSAVCSANVRVEPRPNRPPVMSCSVNPGSVHPGDRVSIAATASDPDNDPLTFAWQSNGGRIVGSGPEVQVDTTGIAAGNYAVTGHVDDGRGGTADCQGQFSLESPPPPAVEARLALRSIYFPTALPPPTKPDVGLIESQQKTLNSLASDFKEYLATKPDAQIVLGGHADHRGSSDYNQALSERRVDITKRYLIGLGIPEANIAVKAYGEEENLTADQVKELVEQHPNLSQEKKDKILNNLQIVTLAQNRRVDITLSGTGQESVRQYPFNAEDSLTLLSPKVGGAGAKAKERPQN